MLLRLSRSEHQLLNLVRLGVVDEAALVHLTDRLGSAFGNLKPALHPVIQKPPREAFEPARGQFNSAKLLSWADGLGNSLGRGRILLLTDEDLYVPGLNYVFGQAQHPGRLAVVSLRRLRTEFHGLKASPSLFLERAFKESVHELGHTYGLGHCQTTGCVMCFSNNILDVDAKNPSFCRRCKELLDSALHWSPETT